MTQKKERTQTRRRKKTLLSKAKKEKYKKRHFSTGAHTLTINSFIIKLTSQIKKNKRSSIVRDYKKDLKHLFDVKIEEGTTSKSCISNIISLLVQKTIFMFHIEYVLCVCVCLRASLVILANFLSGTVFFCVC